MKMDGLMEAYVNQVLTEGDKQGTVNTSLKVGRSFEGEEKAKPKTGDMGIQSAAVKGVDKPEEAPKNLNPGHGKIKTESEEKEIRDMLPESKFDKLFKSQLVEEDALEGDESPLEKTGEEKFDDERGDFPPESGEDTMGEEVDVATELRLIIDRLTEIAERLGAYDEAGEEGEEGLEPETEISPEIAPESTMVRGRPMTEAPVATKELKPLPDTVKKMTSRGNVKVDSAFNVTSTKEGDAGGPGGKEADGKIKPARKTDLGPKMGMKAPVKGPLSKVGAGLFDTV